jgi:hypothetical protein
MTTPNDSQPVAGFDEKMRQVAELDPLDRTERRLAAGLHPRPQPNEPANTDQNN